MRVLLCDDHAMLASSLAHHLTRRGHTTQVVAHPAQAVAALQDDDFDVCLLDVRFGDEPLAGISAIPAVRDASPGTAVVLLSALLTESTSAAALAAGAHSVADKAGSLAQLDRVVTAAGRDHRRGRPSAMPSTGARVVTQREREVLDLVAVGRSTDDIATTLGISPHTVRSHQQSARTKLAARNMVEAVTSSTWASPVD